MRAGYDRPAAGSGADGASGKGAGDDAPAASRAGAAMSPTTTAVSGGGGGARVGLAAGVEDSCGAATSLRAARPADKKNHAPQIATAMHPMMAPTTRAVGPPRAPPFVCPSA